MQPASRVMWKNGTFLTPQHFQQADRYLEAQLSLVRHADSPLAWGVLSVRLDPAALAQGRLKLEACQAFMPPPDGMMIDIPDQDAAPAERSFAIADGAAAIEVFLTVPTAAAAERLVEREQAIEDIYSATSLRQIKVAQKNLALAVSGEPQKNLSALKIAEIERDEQTGKPTLRKSFAPTCVVLRGAPALQQLGRDLLARMAGLSRGLAEARKLRQSDEFVQFLRLVQRYLAPLSHLIEEAAALTHPAQFYEVLLWLAAELSTFYDEPPALPRYDHKDLTRCFRELYQQLDGMLGFSRQPEDQVTVLRPKTEGLDNRYWVGRLPPGKPAAQVPVYLVLRGELPAAKLIAELANKGKLAPAARINELVANFATAVPFQHELNLPPRQQAQPGIYYRVQTSDPLWSEICSSREVAVYIPSLLRGDKLPTVEIIYAGSGGQK